MFYIHFTHLLTPYNTEEGFQDILANLHVNLKYGVWVQ